ncbi:MAG: diphthine synthase [Candidatus Pacearchaeota archaeon]
MAFYLIGLGLSERGISLHGKKIIKNCDKVYLENYTVDFPYTQKDLEKQLKVKLIPADRKLVESDVILKESIENEVALLVYGSPLMATTHISLIANCIEKRIKYKIIHSASIFDAIAESGLSIYRFGKTASIPKWQKNFSPTSFISVIKDNLKIDAHTLILIDIGLSFEDARRQLIESCKKEDLTLPKLIVCSRLGIKSKFFYNDINKFDTDKIKLPFCLILPSKLNSHEINWIKMICKN